MDDEAKQWALSFLKAASTLLPAGLLFVDPTGSVVWENDRWLELCGRESSAEGEPWHRAVHPEDRAMLANRWISTRARAGYLGTFRCPGAAGAPTVCRARSVPVRRHREIVGHLVVVVPDSSTVTAETDGAAVAAKLLDRSGSIVTLLDRQGNWRWSSGGALRLLDYQMAYDDGGDVLQMLHPDDQERGVRTLERALRGEVGRDQPLHFRVKTIDGSWRYFECFVDPLFDDPSVEGMAVYAYDITERQTMLEERERLLSDVRRQADELARSGRRRNELLAALHHEVATPITSISNFAQLLAQEIEPEHCPNGARYLRYLEQGLDRLVRIADDLGALVSDQGTTGFHPEEVDVADLLRGCATSAEARAAEAGVELRVEVDEGKSMVGDPDRIGEAIDNLLTNALKFTPVGGVVTLRARQVDEDWSVEVADTGVGIPPQDLPHVFDQFFRASNARAEGVDGSGIGLSLVKAVAEAHGGQVSVDSDLGRGTAVTMVLRRQPPGWEVGRAPEGAE